MLHQLAFTYMYQTNTTTSWHINGGVLASIIIIAVILGIINIVAWWKTFTKAGRPGWAAIIPVYNYWVLFEISGKPGWWSLFSLLGVIPYLGWLIFLVLYIVAA